MIPLPCLPHIQRNVVQSFSSVVLLFMKENTLYRNRLPWLTECLKTSIKTKNKLYIKWCKSFNETHHKSSVIGRIYNGSVIQYWRSCTPSRSMGEYAVPGLNATFCFLWFTDCVLLFDKNLILGCLWLLVFVLNNILILGIWCSTIPHLPGCFLSLDLLWEYRIRHGANRPLYVTSNYSTWIFCRGVSGFATDCPCGVWCRGLTTCLLHIGPPFENRILNNSWAVGLT